MTTESLKKEEKILAYFVSKCNGQISRTRLMKFLYLADYESRRYFGEKLTDAEYSWYHYGPYDHDLSEHITNLGRLGLISETRVQYPTGRHGYLYGTGPTMRRLDFDDRTVALLDYICTTYLALPLDELLEDIVYQTEPMVWAKQNNARNEALTMGLADGLRQHDLNIAYDQLVLRAFDVRKGTARQHSEAVEQLNNPTHSTVA